MHTDSYNRSAPIADLLDRWTRGTNRFDTPITGLSLHRWEHTTEPTSYMLAPSLWLVLSRFSDVRDHRKVQRCDQSRCRVIVVGFITEHQAFPSLTRQ